MERTTKQQGRNQIIMIERIQQIFFSADKSALIFTGLDFWIFFLFIYSCFAFVQQIKALRNVFLMAVSWFFYYKTNGIFLGLLIFSTIISYGTANLLSQLEDTVQRKVILGCSIATQLLILGYFKYAYFFVDIINDAFGLQLEVINIFAFIANNFKTESFFDIDAILLPLGISFYTFKIISYMVDVYRNKMERVENFFDYAFYVSFFPQVVIGPITRATELVPQIYSKTNISKADFGTALIMILQGLFKKICIGDYLAVNFINRVFENPLSYTGFENVTALVAYSIQIYVDFSGFTDIAAGLCLLMGFKISANFNSPYKAKNVGEFWKRWHISLSGFLKDYLYIPLGGNQHGEWRTNINLMITMLLGGLWHGASWNFVIWGGLNGLGLLIYKQWKKISPYEKIKSWPVTVWKILFTFSFITFTRIFFRTEDLHGVKHFFAQIYNNFGWAIIPNFFISFKYVVAVLLLGFITHWLPDTFKAKCKQKFIDCPYPIQILITIMVVVIIYQSVSADLQPFIYFQF